MVHLEECFLLMCLVFCEEYLIFWEELIHEGKKYSSHFETMRAKTKVFKLTRSLLFRDIEFMINVSHSLVAPFYDFLKYEKKSICQSHWDFGFSFVQEVEPCLGITVDHPYIPLLNWSLILSTLDTHYRSLKQTEPLFFNILVSFQLEL